jgi:putative methionine-R-sulfoxide reductase with GAF domain
MNSETTNIFNQLCKWAGRQDENFTTEAFIYVLLHLQQVDPEAAAVLLHKITGSKLLLDGDQIEVVQIKPQSSTDQGKPDIEIRFHNSLIFIEVKINSDFEKTQISRYRSELVKSGFSNTLLITITKYPYPFYQKDATEQPDINIRWHQISDWLRELKAAHQVSTFLISQFVEFLIKRGTAMSKVTWELSNGLSSFQSLLTMINEALTAQKIPIYRASAAWDWHGYFIEEKKLFVGIYFNKPNCVTINTEVSLKQGTDTSILIGKVDNGRWQNDLDLESEEIHFFARTKASQIECLETFLQNSVNFAKKLV